MAKRKNLLQGAIDSLQELLQIKPVRAAVDRTDKRASPRGKRIIKELGKNFSNQEMAEALEITHQKYMALKRQVKQGKVSSSTLNNLLEQAGERARENSSRPKDEEGFYISDAPIKGKDHFKIDYEEMGQDYIKGSMPWAQDVRPGGFASKQSALNWYGGVTGGKEYFKIIRGRKSANGRYRYHVYDIRTASERARRGSVSGKSRGQKRIDRDRIK